MTKTVHVVAKIALLTAIGAAIRAGGTEEFQPNPKPPLSGREERLTVSTGGRLRTALLYRPRNLADRPAILFVLHGFTGTGSRIRMFTGYDFDRMADQEGFVVVYPDAISGQWNDCRSSTKRPVEEREPEDAAFLGRLAKQVEEELGLAPLPRFVAGYSNGGHMAIRLAVQHPEDVSSIAVFGTSLPAAGEWNCGKAKQPLPVLIINGTEDPVNPFEGGLVRPPAGPPLGTVRSARASAEYFAALTGASEAEVEKLPDRVGDGTWLERLTWRRPDQPDVSLLIVHGGGHTLPNPRASFPAIVGRTSKDASGAELIWAFFEQHLDAGVRADHPNRRDPKHADGPR